MKKSKFNSKTKEDDTVEDIGPDETENTVTPIEELDLTQPIDNIDQYL